MCTYCGGKAQGLREAAQSTEASHFTSAADGRLAWANYSAKSTFFFHFFTFIFSIFNSMLGARIQPATRNLEKVNLLEHIKWYTIIPYWFVIAVVLVKGILGRDNLAMLKSFGIFFSIPNSVNNIIYLFYIFYNKLIIYTLVIAIAIVTEHLKLDSQLIMLGKTLHNWCYIVVI